MPPLWLQRLRTSLKSKFRNFKDGRARRRRKMNAFIARWIPTFTLVLLVAGYLWFLALPSPRIGRNVYIDENGLQPSQVTTYWNWGEVHRADRYLDELERLRDVNASSNLRAEFMAEEFGKLGLASATQKYSFEVHGETIHGVNAYAVFAAPRTSGTETMVISASWRSVIDEGSGALNLRGVATVLSLASFLKRYSHWAKDIVFVIGDGYLDGMHAWLSVYNDAPQSNLKAEPLEHSSGVIWTALNIDYPGHSFSHLGIFHEGLNGRLPNQDLINSFRLIAEHTGGVPVVLYDHLDPQQAKNHNGGLSRVLRWLPRIIRSQPEVVEYATRARNIARQMKHQALGKGSGVHGLFHRYRIDAITIFGVPAEGPHGFHCIGRVVESTLRTMNNLLERLHASFFFYLLTTPKTFLKIGLYLPAPIMISVSLLFGGLQAWVQAGWRQVVRGVDDKEQKEKEQSGLKASSVQVTEWETRPRQVLEAVAVIIATHALGVVSFVAVDMMQQLRWGGGWARSIMTIVTQTALGFSLARYAEATFTKYKTPEANTALIALVLKSLNMCFASALISVTSVLNFSFAAFLAVILGVPLTLTPSSMHLSRLQRILLLSTYIAISSCCVALIDSSAMWYWSVLGVWFAPLMYAVYIPLLYQAFIVCLLAA